MPNIPKEQFTEQEIKEKPEKNTVLESNPMPKRTQSEKIQSTERGLKIDRLYTKEGIHPFDELKWEQRTASISNEKKEVIFEQKEVEFPESWSQLATNIVSSKYFTGKMNSPEREYSVRQLVDRVTRTITDWGKKGNYFENNDSADVFYSELSHLLVTQKMAFNSPVWFNCGVDRNSNQFSACFINSIEDNMQSILGLAKTEGMLFKWGSGTGTNLSPLRSSKEQITGGGMASGPVSFMKGYDAFAGVIKSGGRTRRAAKMVILNVDHPDIEEFILSKAKEEKKAWALIDAGYDPSFNGEAYGSIFFQNANHSIRVSDEFMQAVLKGEKWSTRSILTGEPFEEYDSGDLLKKAVESAYICGDPGIQFDTIINRWHTCANTGRIEASNPCSEYMFLNDTACNLASLNLMKFRREDGEFLLDEFLYAIGITILAQEIIVGSADYPTPRIAQNSRDFRPLGLGYANLGALLMSMGFAYDSLEGRSFSAWITALLTGEAYRVSSLIAKNKSPFSGFAVNRESMRAVMGQHRDALDQIEESNTPQEKKLKDKVYEIWNEVLALGEQYGYRNAQATVLAPTGTIGLMMDCDTTGVEPDIALVKYKSLVGGGFLKIVNRTILLALGQLGYSEKDSHAIVEYVDENATVEGCPLLREEHLKVFDCAFKPQNGNRSIHYLGHVKMMAVLQPFLSGSISKTVNMPQDITKEEIYETYISAWKMGLKSIAIYRDGSKRSQPLNTSSSSLNEKSRPLRRRLPDERNAITHKFSVGGHEGYITVGMYEDGSPGEIFTVMAKEGSVVSGLMDSFATAISLALQYRVPLSVLVDKFSHTRFEPSGYTTNSELPIAKSITDYLFRWLDLKFCKGKEKTEEKEENTKGNRIGNTEENGSVNKNPEKNRDNTKTKETKEKEESRELSLSFSEWNGTSNGGEEIESYEKRIFRNQADAIPCLECGSMMIRSGSCYRCLNCGATSGCS